MTGTNVTVVGPRAIADLTFPTSVPLLVILPRIVALVAQIENRGGPPVWTLTRSVGEPLNMQGTAADNRVAEGEILRLVNTSTGVRAPVVRDLVEVVEDAAGRTPRWGPTTTRTAAAGFVLAAATVLAVATDAAAPPQVAALMLGAAAACLLFVLRLGRTQFEPRPTLLLVAAAVVMAAGCGEAVSSVVAQPGGQQVGGSLLWAAAATAVAAALARWITRAAALVTGGAVMVAFFAGVSGAALSAGSDLADVAAVAGYAGLLAIGALPTVATALGRVLSLDDNGDPAQASVRVGEAQSNLTALLWTFTAISLASATVLARAGDGWSLALVALLGVALLLATRSFSARSQVLPLVTAGLGVLLIAGLLTAMRGGTNWEPVAVLATAASFAAVGITLLRPAPEARTQTKVWLGRLELGVLLVSPAIVLGALGVYGLVARAVS